LIGMPEGWPSSMERASCSVAREAEAAMNRAVDDEGELGRAIEELNGLLLEEESLETTLQRVTDLAVAVIPSCDSCGTTRAGSPGGHADSTPTDALARAADKHQHELGEGPCVDSLRTGEPNRVDDMGTETRWPSYAPLAAKEGVAASLSLPLQVRRRTVAVLNLYSRDGAFTEGDVEVATRFAAQAAVAITNAETFNRTRALVGNLEDALESRDEIGQAKGIVMAQRGCSADEAFEVLRHTSQTSNR
jgi:GAF domain-containing protein